MRAACLQLLVLVVAVGGIYSHARAADKLNVLLIVADDLNNNLGCYGHPLVKSPHIDRLAQRGVRFDRAYCQNPVCNPSRTSFLSGRRSGSDMKGATFLPNHFREHGYFTAEFGKVTHSYGLSAAETKWDLEEKFSAARLVEVLAEHKDRPFFIAAGLGHTHPGFSHTKPFTDLYPREAIPLLSEPADVRANVPPVAFSGVLTQQLSEAEWRKHVASYYAAISTMDAAIGQILDAVDRLKLWDSTVIIFTSDHGRHLGEHGGIYDKRSLFEQSARVPLIVAAPGQQRGAGSPRLVELVDLFPTLTEACGVPAPDGLEGTSFVPLLADPQRPWKKAAFTIATAGKAPGRSVRTERYRYTQWGDATAAELYDHHTDPGEYRNLAHDPNAAEILAEMQQLLKAGWRAVTPDEKQ